MGAIAGSFKDIARHIGVAPDQLRVAAEQFLGYKGLPDHDDFFFRVRAEEVPDIRGWIKSNRPRLPRAKVARAKPRIFKYDVAISFAEQQRPQAFRLAKLVRVAGFNRVFYDRFYEDELWGKDLTRYFEDVFARDSRYCVIFVSQAYLERMWTNFELQMAVSRALELKGNEYILPIKVETSSKLPGGPAQIGYQSLEQKSLQEIADLLIKKLRKTVRRPRIERT